MIIHSWGAYALNVTEPLCRELTRNSQTCDKQNRENTCQRKKNHTHKPIFTWFGNLPTFTELQEFHYYQGKVQSATVQYFSLSRTITTRNPNHQKTVLHSTHKIHNGLQNGPKIVHECSGLGLSTQASAPWTKPQKISH